MAINEKSYGPDHPDVANRLNNLAGLLQNTNRLSEAEPLYRRALAINEKGYGPDHPDVANLLNNLGSLLSRTNRRSEAEPLYRRDWRSTRRAMVRTIEYGSNSEKFAVHAGSFGQLERRNDHAQPQGPKVAKSSRNNSFSWLVRYSHLLQCECRLLARNRHGSGRVGDVPVLGVDRKSDFGAVRSGFDPAPGVKTEKSKRG